MNSEFGITNEGATKKIDEAINLLEADNAKPVKNPVLRIILATFFVALILIFIWALVSNWWVWRVISKLFYFMS